MCRSLKKLKLLIKDPYIVDVKVHVLSFNMTLVSLPWVVPSPGIPFRGKMGRLGKEWSTEKVKYFDRGPYGSEPERPGGIFHCDPISSPKHSNLRYT